MKKEKTVSTLTGKAPAIRKMDIKGIIQETVGKSFEIDCKHLQIKGFLDFLDPYFEGPGSLSGKSSGKFDFKIYGNKSQVETVKQQLENSGLDDSKKEAVRVFASDYQGREWTGGWTSFPLLKLLGNYEFDDCVIRGSVDQLSTGGNKHALDQDRNITELVYPSAPNIPLNQAVQQTKSFNGKNLISKTWYDRQEISIGESKIIFFGGDDDDFFHITAEHKGLIKPTYVEAQLPYALSLITGQFCFPRIVIRNLQDYTHLFLRQTKTSRSGMPAPIIGMHQEQGALWDMFKCCLEYMASRDLWEPPQFIRQLLEIITSSRDSIHTFISSLSIAIENLALTLADFYNVERIDEKSRLDLMNHFEEWNGNEGLKNRARGMLGMLKDTPVKHILKELVEARVINKQHLKAWEEIRPKVAHGHLYDLEISEKEWYYRNCLISMVHRLILRIIEYRGYISEYSEELPNTKEFDWK